MKKHLKELQDSLDKARFSFRAAVRLEQQTCLHDNIEECDYLPQKFIHALPPLRVCDDCGLAEEGWGPGYVVLKGKVGAVSRSCLYSKKLGFTVRDQHKGPILRGEVTLDQLLVDSD